VPETDQISQVRLSPYAASYYIDNEYVALTDSQDIMAITDVHKTLIKERRGTRGDTMTFWMRYYLKDGRTVTRKYAVEIASSEAQTLKTFYTDFTYVTGAYDVDHIQNNVETIEFFGHKAGLPNILFGSKGIAQQYPYEDFLVIEEEDMKNSQVVRGLLEAIKADCEAGNMAQQWDFHRDENSMGSLHIMTTNYWALEGRSVTVFESCTNTVKYLKSLAEEMQQTGSEPLEPEQTEQAPQVTEPMLVS